MYKRQFHLSHCTVWGRTVYFEFLFWSPHNDSCSRGAVVFNRKAELEGCVRGMQNTGVEMKGKVVKVDEYLRTNVPHIWALGDVIGRIELTPVALMEGMAFAANCFGKEGITKPDYGSVPSAVRCRTINRLSLVSCILRSQLPHTCSVAPCARLPWWNEQAFAL